MDGWLSIAEVFDDEAPDGIWDRRALDRSIRYERIALTDGRRMGPRPKKKEVRDGSGHR